MVSRKDAKTQRREVRNEWGAGVGWAKRSGPTMASTKAGAVDVKNTVSRKDAKNAKEENEQMNRG